MRRPFHDLAEKGRVNDPRRPSAHGDPYGDFILRHPSGAVLQVIACDGEETGWDHVSVSVRKPGDEAINAGRCPTWEEMCWVKGLFWGPDEVVVQYHPAEKDYVNRHPFVLHMWRCVPWEFPTPGTWMV